MIEPDDDDDIVTRLWAKNLETITVVTAEELVRSSGSDRTSSNRRPRAT